MVATVKADQTIVGNEPLSFLLEPIPKDSAALGMWVARLLSTQPKCPNESHFPKPICEAAAAFRQKGDNRRVRRAITKRLRQIYDNEGKFEVPLVEDPEM